MRLASVIVSLSIALYPAFACGGQKPVNAAGSAEPASAVPVLTQNDIQDLRQQVQTMRSLVQQMEMNLAFVDTTQSPLKHQFQLEIDMWNTVIAEMERKLNSPKRP
jgi:hypothetical protein